MSRARHARRVAACAALLLGVDSLPALAAVAPPASMTVSGIPGIPEALVERMAQYNHARSCIFEGWLPEDGGALVSTRFADTRQVHLVRFPGGDRSQLTFFDEPLAGAQVSPSQQAPAFTFSMDQGGDERYQLYWFDLTAREIHRLTHDAARSGSVVWDRAGRRIAFQSTRRNGRDFDVWVMDPRAPEAARMVLEGEGRWFPLDWSFDERKLLVRYSVSASQAQLWVVDLESGDRTQVQPGAPAAAFGGACFDRDGQGVYAVSDQGGEFQQLWHLPLGGGAPRSLSADLPWDVEELSRAADGRWLAFAVNVDGTSQLHLLETRGGKRRRVELPHGVLSRLQFEPRGARLGFVLNGPTTPGDVFSLEPRGDRPGERLLQWTQSEVGGLDPRGFVPCELIHFPTFDDVAGQRREIAAYLYRPPGPGPHPVVISFHGGPEEQARPEFASYVQFWVKEQGIAVLQPNVRGSTGYGRAFQMLDDGEHREDALRDVEALLAWIEQQPDLDAERVGLYGGSYGGYLVLASLVRFGERIGAAVDYVGISDFVTFLEGTAENRRDARRAEYGDERDPRMRAYLRSISPLQHAQRIQSPLLVAHGGNDPRVPAGETEQIVQAVRANGREVWTILAPDEGHGFRKKPNVDYYRLAVALFWERHLLGDSTGAPDRAP